jgi:hypothetical protein
MSAPQIDTGRWDPFHLSRDCQSTNDYEHEVTTGPLVWEGGQGEETFSPAPDTYYSDTGQFQYFVQAPVLDGYTSVSDLTDRDIDYDPAAPWNLTVFDISSALRTGAWSLVSDTWHTSAEHAMNAAVTHHKEVMS